MNKECKIIYGDKTIDVVATLSIMCLRRRKNGLLENHVSNHLFLQIC